MALQCSPAFAAFGTDLERVLLSATGAALAAAAGRDIMLSGGHSPVMSYGNSSGHHQSYWERPKMSIFGKIMSAIFGSSASAAAPDAAPAAGGSAAPAGGAAPAATVDVAPILDAAVKAKGEKLEWRTSIVDLMKALDIDSSLSARKELAKELGYTGDTNDSASMNIWLHKQVMTKFAANGGKLPDDLKH
jgi:Domain of unknown function (DUF3597)